MVGKKGEERHFFLWRGRRFNPGQLFLLFSFSFSFFSFLLLPTSHFHFPSSFSTRQAMAHKIQAADHSTTTLLPNPKTSKMTEGHTKSKRNERMRREQQSIFKHSAAREHQRERVLKQPLWCGLSGRRRAQGGREGRKAWRFWLRFCFEKRKAAHHRSFSEQRIQQTPTKAKNTSR